MKNLYHEMIERIKTLIHQQVELVEQFRKLELAKRENESEFDAAKTYILTSHDPAIKRELEKINELKKELLSVTKRTQKVVESKSHLVIRLLQEHGREGLDVDEIMTLLTSNGAEIDRNYLMTILGKLRKREMVIKQGNKFFITAPGQKPAASLRLVKDSQPQTTAV
jgi:small-conductance mechanosensitive channel